MRSPLPRFSLKYFLACLCRIYGQISRGETPEKMKMDDRAYTAIYERFSPESGKSPGEGKHHQPHGVDAVPPPESLLSRYGYTLLCSSFLFIFVRY